MSALALADGDVSVFPIPVVTSRAGGVWRRSSRTNGDNQLCGVVAEEKKDDDD